MTNTPATGEVWVRLLGITVLLIGLGGLLVWAGTVPPDATDRDYPDEDEVVPNPGAYVGERVALSGTVIATDPVVIEGAYGTGEPYTATIRGVDEPTAEGDRMTAFGTLEDASALEAERVIVREPWEMWYMYGVSFIAGLWVLGRTLRRWRFDTEQLAFVPREEPLAAWGDRNA